jgi:Sec-independent protein translocase protein TatA
VPFLSPAKVIIILVVALAVLGPEALPRAARQIGGLWADLKRLRRSLETEVRDSFPDLPSTETITRAVRSPLSLLDHLSGEGAPDLGPAEASGSPTVTASVPPSTGPAYGWSAAFEETPSGPDLLIAEAPRPLHGVSVLGDGLDDPGLN